nr:immediate early response gene 2 protein [Anolis sagrei ordinatus]
MMEVQKEAQRIMTMSVWKMYHSRMQRGGLRLHRSLQLSLVMRSARDLYLSAKLEDDGEDEAMPAAHANQGLDGEPSPPTPFPAAAQEEPPPEPMDTQPEAEAVERRAESAPPSSRTWSRAGAAKASRKRRSSSLGKMGALEAGLAPSKKARLATEEEEEEEEEGRQREAEEEGPFPSLARVLQGRFSARAHAPPLPLPEPAKDEPPANCCRPQGEGVLSIMVRAVVAF